MACQKNVNVSKIQLMCEKGLLFAVWLLGVMFMLLAAFRYVIDYTLITPFVKWYALLVILAVLLYLLITVYKYPQTKYRIRDFLRKMKSFEQIFMVALFLWFIVVCLVRQLMDNYNYFRVLDWWLLDTAATSLVVFPLSYYLIEAKKRKYLDLMLHIIAISYSVFSVWCLWHAFHLNILTLPSGGQVGMTRKMELCLGCHWNLTGAIAFVILAISCYMMFTQKTVWKIFYAIIAVIQLFVSLLSNSRTVYVCVLFLGASCAFLWAWSLLKNRKTMIKLIICSALAALCVLALWRLRSAVFVLFDSVTHFTTLLGSEAAGTAEDAARELVGLSGREKIWGSALKIMVSSPDAFFFGLTPINLPSALHTYGPLSFEPAHAHNIFLQVGASLGVPAMIAFVVFLFRVFVRCIRLIKDSAGKELYRYGMLAVIFASLIIMNLAEAYLLVYFSIMGLVFFLACGDITFSDQASDNRPLLHRPRS